MNYRFHPEAEAEFAEAIDFYEEKERGLGFDFAAEVHSAIERIVAFPSAWPAVEGDVRRSLIRRFPYGILYSVEQEGIYILAVMHLHRNPEYWKSRI
jgi:plasmid stabilization system protein ParE